MLILEETSAHDFDELDWSQTYLIQPDSDAAWLSRDGVWHGCNSTDHDDYARFVLKQPVAELERVGWCRVLGSPSSSHSGTDWIIVRHRLSAEQRNELSRRGHDLSLDG
jgi:hypothetical protein